MSATTGLLLFYAILGFLAVIGALLAYAVATTRRKEEEKQNRN